MKVLKILAKLALWVGVPLGIIALILRLVWVEVAVVGHDGMMPTVAAGEQVFLWKTDTFEVGDIVICAHPNEPGGMVLGRIIGRGGMNISTERGNLQISGTRPVYDWKGQYEWGAVAGTRYRYRWGLEELGNTTHYVQERAEGQGQLRIRNVSVATGKVYLLGDNRGARETDSRSFGQVDENTCLGTVFMHFQPVEYDLAEPAGEEISSPGMFSLID